MTKLIIIRGNSGSGKSSLAKALRERMDSRTALIEQDYLRRTILGEMGKGGDDNIELIKQTAIFSLNKGYNVILEGIMHREYYEKMLRELLDSYRDNLVVFYDIPLEETFKRHVTKHNAHEFGEKELKEWFREGESLGVDGEIIITEEQSLNDATNRVLSSL